MAELAQAAGYANASGIQAIERLYAAIAESRRQSAPADPEEERSEAGGA